MDAYPHHYVAHNLPFVKLFGLEPEVDDAQADDENAETELHLKHLRENEYTYEAELPPVCGPAADALRQAFRDLDARDASWNSRPGPGKMGSVGFTYGESGQKLRLPPHKAPPPPQSDLEDLPSSWQTVLHSPISPLTPSSPLYPDGILTPAWAAKHQKLLPTAIICFYSFTIDATRSSLEDNALKIEINRLRSWFGETRYATRIVVVLVCDAAVHVSTVVERLGNIRRATNLDTKTLLYMPGGLSLDECRAFVGSLLSNIHATCIEYYRDLSKHARRKKNRGSTPTPTLPPTLGTSQVLSARGWNLRYEMKLGVFAEFRGEMEAAERNYEQAYEDLMDGDILEGISNWSPRFNEARLLADVLAIRILRCLLWTNQTTSAAQSWSNHRYRMRGLLDKKGKGTTTYAWPAWEAIWSRVMAEVIEKVQIPYFFVPSPTDEAPLVTANIHAPPERTISKDVQISPWDHLHHAGYWHERAAKSIRARRLLASNLPPEDRRSPGESPASMLASRSHMYDTYLCLEPHQEYKEVSGSRGAHSQLLLSSLSQAELHANARQKARTLARLRLEMAQELALRGDWDEASELVRTILEKPHWRQEGWWQLLGDTYILAQRCFAESKDKAFLLSTTWQAQSSLLTIPSHTRPSLDDVMKNLEGDEPVCAEIDTDETIPCLLTSFTFGTDDACIGDPLYSQLTVTPALHDDCDPFTLSSLRINFKGSVGTVDLKHKASQTSRKESEYLLELVELQQVANDADAERNIFSYFGEADLSFNPTSPRVYQFSVIPRESDELRAESLEMTVAEGPHALQIKGNINEPVSRPLWWESVADTLSKRYLNLRHTCKIEVKPRPPKMQITLPGLEETYYTDEAASLTIKLINDETETADVRLKVHIFHGGMSADIKWADQGDGRALVSEAGSTLPQREVGGIDAAQSQEFTLSIDRIAEMGKITLEVEAVYTLTNDPSTIITKSVSQDLTFVRPFESNYETSAGIHPDTWPSFFKLADSGGLTQRSQVTAKVLSYTTEAILIEDIELMQIPSDDTSVSYIITTDRPKDSGTVVLQPQELRNCVFTVDSQKKVLEDRAPADAQFNLAIRWRRQVSNKPSADSSTAQSPSTPHTTCTTILPGPNIRLDFGKPRALVSADVAELRSGPREVQGTPVVHMRYMIENPSDYVLQFGVSMDATEQFAFTGPKASTLQLTPFSRAEVKFSLLPFARALWISPVVRIQDIGFSETLRVHAAEGVRSEKGRCLVWVPEIVMDQAENEGKKQE